MDNISYEYGKNFPITEVRENTPGCKTVSHFNNAGAALMPSLVIEAVKSHIDLESTLGGYEAAEEKQAELDAFYEQAALLIHAKPSEIAFCDNATRAWQAAFYAMPFSSGDVILTCRAEYASNYISMLQVAKRTGAVIKIIPDDEFGQVSVQALESLIDKNVKLIAITHVPTNGGLINPAAQIGEIAKHHQIPYLLDATQSVGQMPIDVNAIGCDYLCATGRKYLRGPRGTGFLYVNTKQMGHHEPHVLDLHAATLLSENAYTIREDAKRFETWETNLAGKLGLAKAIEYANQLGIDSIWSRTNHLATYLRDNLSQIQKITQHDLGKEKCGIVTFAHKDYHSQQLKEKLYQQKINVSISIKNYSLDMAPRKLDAIVRASLHYYNTEAEIDLLCESLEAL